MDTLDMYYYLLLQYNITLLRRNGQSIFRNVAKFDCVYSLFHYEIMRENITHNFLCKKRMPIRNRIPSYFKICLPFMKAYLTNTTSVISTNVSQNLVTEVLHNIICIPLLSVE